MIDIDIAERGGPTHLHVARLYMLISVSDML